MNDTANLNLNVQSNQAVTALTGVQNELKNTTKESDTLVNSLKAIGITVGFTKLLKQTLQLSNDLKSVNSRFSAIFGSDRLSGLDALSSKYNLTDASARRVTATLGKFSMALGNTSAQTRKFAIDMGNAATALASAFSIDNVDQVAQQLGQATLGRTRALQEYGIAIDTTSAAFKNMVKEIQTTTGATEAQAKQMAIANEIMRQTKNIAGESGNDIFDAWSQLNKLWSNVKEVLSTVGTILAATIGPVIAGINAILSTSIGKAMAVILTLTGLWTAAVTGVEKITKSINKSTESIKNLNKSTTSEIAKQNALLLKQSTMYELNARNIRSQNITAYKDYMLKTLKSYEKHSGNVASFDIVKQIDQGYDNLEGVKRLKSLYELNRVLKKINDIKYDKLHNGIDILDKDFVTFKPLTHNIKIYLQNNKKLSDTFANLSSQVIKTNVAVGTLNTSLKATSVAAHTASTAKSAESASSLGEGLLVGIIMKVGKAFSVLVSVLKFVLVAVGYVVAGILALANIVHWFQKGLNAISGNSGKSTIIEDMFTSMWLYFDNKNNKELSELSKQKLDTYKKINANEQELAQLWKDFKAPDTVYKKLSIAIRNQNELQKALKKAEKAYKEKASIGPESAEFYYGEQLGNKYSGNERTKEAIKLLNKDIDAAFTSYKELLKQFGDATNSVKEARQAVIDYKKKKIEEMLSFNNSFTELFDNIRDSIRSLYDTVGDKKLLKENIQQRLDDFQAKIDNAQKNFRLYNNGRTLEDAEFDKRYIKNYRERIAFLKQEFAATKGAAQLRLEQLAKEKERVKKLFDEGQEAIKNASGYLDTSRKAVEVGSMEAAQLQNRRFATITGLDPVVESQKEMKDLTAQQLEVAKKADERLSLIGRGITTLTKQLQFSEKGLGARGLFLIDAFAN